MSKKTITKKEESEILKHFESGKFKRVKNVQKEKARYAKSANFTAKKTKTINIRLSEKDLSKIKASALKEGLPYQTFITSILHRLSSKDI